MEIQLWSYNYDPEPTGIAPLSAVFAQEMTARGHRVTVVAAHPHYPEPQWGARLRPYRELRDGIRVLRLPLAIGRATMAARLKQEASFAAALSAAAPLLPRPDVLVAVSPSFPALAPAMARAAAGRFPWVLWLQDILPDGAAATGLLKEGKLVQAARRFEALAYRRADRIVVISDSFRDNLKAKGVPMEKVVRVYNPASRFDETRAPAPTRSTGGTVLTMGNIGLSQNLVAVTQAFEGSTALADAGASFVMAGDGVLGDEVRSTITTDRVRVTGVLDWEPLERELEQATVAVVSQRYDGIDFNVPSKLMNFMAYGIPVVAAVREESEVARIIRNSGAGWVTDAALEQFPDTLALALKDQKGREERGQAGYRYAREHFAPRRFGSHFETVLEDAVSRAAA